MANGDLPLAFKCKKKLGRGFHADSPNCQKHLLLTLLASVINGNELVHCVGQRQLFIRRD